MVLIKQLKVNAELCQPMRRETSFAQRFAHVQRQGKHVCVHRQGERKVAFTDAAIGYKTLRNRWKTLWIVERRFAQGRASTNNKTIYRNKGVVKRFALPMHSIAQSMDCKTKQVVYDRFLLFWTVTRQCVGPLRPAGTSWVFLVFLENANSWWPIWKNHKKELAFSRKCKALRKRRTLHTSYTLRK